MKHPLDWTRPAKLIRRSNAAQFGDGYRQTPGPTVAEGSVDELVDRLRAMPPAEQRIHYICNEGGVPQNIDEIEEQAAERSDDGL